MRTIFLILGRQTSIKIDFKRAYYNPPLEIYLKNAFNIPRSIRSVNTKKSVSNKTYINENGYLKIVFNTPRSIRSVNTKKSVSNKTYINENGYRCFKNSGLSVHRWKMQKHLGRKLLDEEVVHHINGNKLNNNISNLRLFDNQDEHDRHHRENLIKYGSWHDVIPSYATYNNGKQYAKQF